MCKLTKTEKIINEMRKPNQDAIDTEIISHIDTSNYEGAKLPSNMSEKFKLTNTTDELGTEVNFIQCLDERRRVIGGIDSDELPLPDSLNTEDLSYETSENEWVNETKLGIITSERAT